MGNCGSFPADRFPQTDSSRIVALPQSPDAPPSIGSPLPPTAPPSVNPLQHRSGEGSKRPPLSPPPPTSPPTAITLNFRRTDVSLQQQGSMASVHTDNSSSFLFDNSMNSRTTTGTTATAAPGGSSNRGRPRSTHNCCCPRPRKPSRPLAMLPMMEGGGEDDDNDAVRMTATSPLPKKQKKSRRPPSARRLMVVVETKDASTNTGEGEEKETCSLVWNHDQEQQHSLNPRPTPINHEFQSVFLSESPNKLAQQRDHHHRHSNDCYTHVGSVGTLSSGRNSQAPSFHQLAPPPPPPPPTPELPAPFPLPLLPPLPLTATSTAPQQQQQGYTAWVTSTTTAISGGGGRGGSDSLEVSGESEVIVSTFSNAHLGALLSTLSSNNHQTTTYPAGCTSLGRNGVLRTPTFADEQRGTPLSCGGQPGSRTSSQNSGQGCGGNAGRLCQQQQQQVRGGHHHPLTAAEMDTIAEMLVKGSSFGRRVLSVVSSSSRVPRMSVMSASSASVLLPDPYG